jgi:hypothetical protein
VTNRTAPGSSSNLQTGAKLSVPAGLSAAAAPNLSNTCGGLLSSVALLGFGEGIRCRLEEPARSPPISRAVLQTLIRRSSSPYHAIRLRRRGSAATPSSAFVPHRRAFSSRADPCSARRSGRVHVPGRPAARVALRANRGGDRLRGAGHSCRSDISVSARGRAT